MKIFEIIASVIFVTIIQISAWGATQQVPLSVTAFEDKSAQGDSPEGCRGTWWFVSNNLGSAFKDVLVEKLQEKGRFQILEREHINQIYQNEFELVNSEKVKKAPRGHFKVARYTLAGVVTEFEWCQEGGGGGINLGGLLGIPEASIHIHTSKATVKVNIRLIDAETGEILYTASGSGERKLTGADVGLVTQQVGFDAGGFKQSPLGQAVKEAVDDAAEKVMTRIPSA